MTISLSPLVIYGASGHAIAISDHVENRYSKGPLYQVVAYIDDFCGDNNEEFYGAPIISYERWQRDFRDVDCFVSVGDTKARRHLSERIANTGGKFGSLVAVEKSIAVDFSYGEGSFVSPFCFIGPVCHIGRHVQIMPNCSLGHDVRVGNYVTICPGTCISGYVNVEDEVFFGAGSVVVNGSPDRPLNIGKGAFVLAGAVVTKSVLPGVKVVGNPARPIRQFKPR